MTVYFLLVDIFLLILAMALIIEMAFLLRWKRSVERRLEQLGGQPMPGIDQSINRSAFGGSPWGGGRQ